ncbi:MAG TPA: ribosome maturation factor RimM [Pyrinomonadaceae bacterium]|jgi:16S rRNA processing protein RimM|nr:ribosome maturation factor RimM [Pyrinomonadaceae bacterium]
MDDDASSELIVIARAVKPRGLKGEIVAELLTDFPERFEDVDELVLVSPAGERSTKRLEAYWFQNDRVVLKLSGYDEVDTAKELVGFEFAVPESERVPLPADHYYDWELEGCTVKVGDDSIGQVNSVLRTGGAEILVVTDNSGKERLIPFADSIVVEVDPVRKTIVVDPPEGLLDL